MSNSPEATQAPSFYGWRMVQGCVVVAFVAWSFALYGPSVYLSALSQTHDWPIGQISSALTLSFFVNALTISFVGTLLGRHGPRLIMTVGAILMATGLILLGQINALWQTFIVFPIMGVGWSCLSTIAISATIAPWFERQQGKAISTALLGASLGGMFGIPIVLFLVERLGLPTAMSVIGAMTVLIVIPIALGVLRRRPQDLGQHPDGLPPSTHTASTTYAQDWSRSQALRTYALRSVILAFGMGLMVQIGFLSQQVKLLQMHLSSTSIAITILCSGALAFLARVILGHFADRIQIRQAAAIVLLLSALGMLLTGLSQSTSMVILGVLLFGFNVGNLTTLPALIVRREFGSASFGRVFGITGTCMQLMSSLGPAIFGLLYDVGHSYTVPLLLAAVLLVVGALVIVKGQLHEPFRRSDVNQTPKH